MMGQSSAVILLHLRRLDGFLRRHGLRSTAHTLERESLVFFDAAHLQKLVRKGRWDAAWRYMHRFSPLFSEEGGEGPSHHYTAFLRTLEHHGMLDYLACRGDEGGRAAKSLYSRVPDDAYRDKFPEMAKQQDLYRTMASPQARASLDWDHIKLTTLEKLHELLHLHPDIQSSLRMRLPQHTPTLLDIAPLGLRGPRRYHQRKRIDRKPAHELANFLLQKRLPSADRVNHSCDSGVCSDSILQPTMASNDKPLGVSSSIATNVLRPNLASEIRNADMCASVVSTGVKRIRCQDDYCTEDAHQALDFAEGLKRQKIVGRCWPAPGVDTTAVAEMLGRDGKLGDAGVGGNKSRKCKMNATDAEASIRA